MKIKRFVAADMRSAFALVKEEHGPDAVILSNRMTDEGVEIVAASNYDETLVQQTLRAMRPAAASSDAPLAGDAGDHRSEPEPEPETHAAQVRARQEDAGTVRPPTPAEAAAAYFQRKAEAARPATTPPPCRNADAAASTTVVAQAPADARNAPAVADIPDTTGLAEGFAARLADYLPVAPAAAAPIAAAPVVVVAGQDPDGDAQILRMRAELAAMRHMIEREMTRLTDERLRGSPVRAQAMELMEDYGFDAGLTRDIVLQIPADTELHRGRGLMLGMLAQRLPIAPADPLEEGGVIALVGPTGAGKTTTIAKLAAAYAARHGAREVALITTDTQRIGGREQLHGYGRQLGIAVHEADSDTALAEVLDRVDDYRLVLIDTAGLGQRDRNLAGQLNWLRGAGRVRVLLVLPANAHFSDLDETVRRFGGARPQGVVLTKLDETGRLGSPLSVVVDHGLPLVWVTDGQEVPRDLHRANAANLVLRLDPLRREADAALPVEAAHVA